MPTFPNHWAGISGSLEEKESPLECAVRELGEETNINELFMEYEGDRVEKMDSKRGYDNNEGSRHELLQSSMKEGLYLDIAKKSSNGAFGGRVIRVYPFALKLQQSTLWSRIEMRGTEHDEMRFMDVHEFLVLSPCVPGLQTAFHHATAGFFLRVSIVWFCCVLFLSISMV